MQFIDLSHSIDGDMSLFAASAPRPRITAWQSHAQAAASGNYADCTCEINEVKFVTSIGTYLDSPFHFNPAGRSIEALELEQLILPGVVVDCSGVSARAPIGPDVLRGLDIVGKAVLFRTGWSRHWKRPEYLDFPFLREETAIALRDGGAKLAGVDFLVIDDTTNPRRPVHVTLLHSEILIVENLTNLAALPDKGFTFHAVPVKFAGAAAFPVRAFATLQ